MAKDSTNKVFLTGATGFVGWHVLRALLDAGYSVKSLVRSEPPWLQPTARCEIVHGDLKRAGELIESLRGCRFIVHTAALYTFAPAKRADVWRTNVQGTASLLEAASLAGVERAVVTSSSATVGPATDGRLASEADFAAEHDSVSAYHHSKIEQERAALKATLPVVLVLPTTPVGPEDRKPTPTGKMIVDFMRGKIFGSLPGGMNLVPVEDVAKAHIAVLERGRIGERYLVGSENLKLTDIWTRLAEICGRSAPTRQIPYGLAAAFGWADELRCRVFRDQQPLVPLEGVHMARDDMFVDVSKTRRELGFTAGPVTPALERAVEWFRQNGYDS